LSCQAFMGKLDVVIEIPKYTINHAKENHWKFLLLDCVYS
jgi:2Fe-2S ferredoxin